MPKIDFAEVPDATDCAPLPAGSYMCEVEKVQEKTTCNGDEMWRLWFVVAEGEYRGRYVFDNLVFSEAALKRAKLICSRLGIDVSQTIDLTPSLLIGRRCRVTAEIENYTDLEGREKQRNTVPFGGYERLEQDSESTAQSATDDKPQDDLPF